MTSQLTTEEQAALDTIQTAFDAREDSVHESLFVHWMREETSLDESEAQELLQTYAIYTTDKYGNDVITSIGDEPSEEKTYIGDTDN